MQIKEKVLLHNKFDVKVVDSRTGEVKQTATAYLPIRRRYQLYGINTRQNHSTVLPVKQRGF